MHYYSTKVALEQVHEIPLRDFFYVDVIKTTGALHLLSDSTVMENNCFSLLTKHGSFHLQIGNQLEGDALISCFCLILDTMIGEIENEGREKLMIGTNWRDLQNTVLSCSNDSFSARENSSSSSCNKYKVQEIVTTAASTSTSN